MISWQSVARMASHWPFEPVPGGVDGVITHGSLTSHTTTSCQRRQDCGSPSARISPCKMFCGETKGQEGCSGHMQDHFLTVLMIASLDDGSWRPCCRLSPVELRRHTEEVHVRNELGIFYTWGITSAKIPDFCKAFPTCPNCNLQGARLESVLLLSRHAILSLHVYINRLSIHSFLIKASLVRHCAMTPLSWPDEGVALKLRARGVICCLWNQPRTKWEFRVKTNIFAPVTCHCLSSLIQVNYLCNSSLFRLLLPVLALGTLYCLC